jgi:hypothetical protein
MVVICPSVMVVAVTPGPVRLPETLAGAGIVAAV